MPTNIDRVRLENLKVLHARAPGAGAPTSDSLVKFLKGKQVSITKTDLSNIYWGRKAIDKKLASEIEKAFDLPFGWMDDAHDHIFFLTSAENLVLSALRSVPKNISQNLSSLILSISKIGND